MDAAVIINPIAGKGAGGSEENLARLALRQHGLSGTVMTTSGPGHARELARGFVNKGTETIVAWGGDGTVNEVASEVVHHAAMLGIVPQGSGNGLARELGLPLQDPLSALEVALNGKPRWIDAGELGWGVGR